MTEQQTFQFASGGSIPTPSLQFSAKSPLSKVSGFVKEHHYSHTHPGGTDYCFSLEYENIFAGAAMFGYIAGNAKAMCVLKGHDDPSKYRELQRLVLLDRVPKNSESQFIGWCLRWLKKNTDLLAIVSFADPKYGHAGVIYQASNWIYIGKQKPARPRIILGGKEIHPKELFNLYGTSSVSELRNHPQILGTGTVIETSEREAKHKYVYVLRPELRYLVKGFSF